MSVVELQVVPLEYIQQCWDTVAPILTKAFGKSPTNTYYTLDTIKAALVRGEQTLIIAVDQQQIIGACTLAWMNYTHARVAHITCLAGRGICTRTTHKNLMAWVKHQGGTHIRAETYPSLIKLCQRRFGYLSGHTIMEITL